MWQFIAGLILAMLASYFLRPKPQNIPPAGIDDIKAPTAEQGRDIPVLFGTKELTGPNVVWYGDLRTDPIKKSGGKKG